MSLYRYMSFENFIDIVINNRLTIVSSILWEDVYDDWLLKPTPNSEDASGVKNRQLATTMLESIYTQYWSLNKYLAPLWSLYSYNKHAIMLKTTDCEVEKIDGIILKRIKYSKNISASFEGITSALFSSRPEDWFISIERNQDEVISENEVQLLKIYDNREPNEIGNGFYIPNITDFIKNITVHPLADSRYVEIVESVCKKYNLVFCGKFKLYDLEA